MRGEGGRESGAALMTALIAMVVIALLTAGVMGLTIAGSQLTVTNRDHGEALYVAESGVVEAMYRLPGAGWTTFDASPSQPVTGKTSSGDYSIIDVEPPAASRSISTDFIEVTSVGTVTSTDAPDKVTRKVWMRLRPNWPRYFGFALAALDNGKSPMPMQIGGGSFIDGYASSAGSYSSQAVNYDVLTGKTYADKDANIGSNGWIDSSGSSVVMGSAMLQDLNWIKNYKESNFSPDSGVPDLLQLDQTIAREQFDTSTATTDLLVKGSLTLSAGTYYFRSITVQGTLNIGPGRVIIYVQGDIKVESNGKIINTSTDPTNLLIFSMGSTVTINANTQAFYGGIYAPNATVTINGNAGFYGSVTGLRVKIASGSNVHYDRSLQDVRVGDPTGFGVVRWKELPPEQGVPAP